MKPSRRKVEEGLWVLGLHRFGRSLNLRCGRNIGAFSALFASLGHPVVAIEPNLDCVRHVQISYSDLPITILNAALGPRTGLITMNVSDDRDDLSSVCADWIPQTIGSRKVPVAMLTLNDLISEYGVPVFIKIDVEVVTQNRPMRVT